MVAEPVDTAFFKPSSSADESILNKNRTKFLFVGKWEERKGLKILLRAFLKEFEYDDESAKLTILTSAYHSANKFWDEITEFVSDERLVKNILALGKRIEVISNVPQSEMPSLYNSADALVIPSRGEGWGRPHVEAMACGVPVVATNWSGPTVYLDDMVGYPLRVNGLVPAGGWKGHKWADPSESHLRNILREIHDFPDIAREKGVRAREKMEHFYSIPAIADVVAREVKRILQFVEGSTVEAAIGEL